jgi:AcrR family transcriptional regulator
MTKIPSTVRDPKILAQRRAELVEVATTLFLEKGFHKTSIRDIARACPFNLAALYMYVSSKEDILYLVAQHLVGEIIKALGPAALTNLEPADALISAFETYCRIVDRYSRHIRLLYREIESLSKETRQPLLRSVESLVDVFGKLVARAIQAGEIRDVDPYLTSLDLMVAAHSWALHGRLLRSRLNIDAFTKKQSAIVFNGLLVLPTALNNRKARGIVRSTRRNAAHANVRKT